MPRNAVYTSRGYAEFWSGAKPRLHAAFIRNGRMLGVAVGLGSIFCVEVGIYRERAEADA